MKPAPAPPEFARPYLDDSAHESSRFASKFHIHGVGQPLGFTASFPKKY
jgi:hypothetical protein